MFHNFGTFAFTSLARPEEVNFVVKWSDAARELILLFYAKRR